MTHAQRPATDTTLPDPGPCPRRRPGHHKKKARSLFLKFHPDLHPDRAAECEERIKGIIAAYTALCGAIRAAPEAEQEQAPRAAELSQVLVFRVSGRLLAVDMGAVREVARVSDVRLYEAGLLSDAFPFLAGLFQKEREISVLWNLHRQFHVRETPIASDIGRAKIVIMEYDGSSVGFLTDEVLGIAGASAVENTLLEQEGLTSDMFCDRAVDTDYGPAGLLNVKNILYNTL